MAKIRIYELARELLESEWVDKVKAEVLGTKPKEYAYEETRVQATVIRRRRKAVPKEEKDADLPPEPLAADSVEPPESTSIASVEAPAPDQEPIDDTKEAVAAPRPEESGPAEQEAAPATFSDSAIATASSPPTEAPRPEPESSSDEHSVPETAPPVNVAEKPLDKTPAEETALKQVKTKKDKKKGKETPAKIIQLAPSPPPAAPVEPTPPEEPVETPSIADSDLPKKKGKKEKTEDIDESDRRFFKRKIAFKRRSVVEGADLYSKKKQRRQGNKWAKKNRRQPAKKPRLQPPRPLSVELKLTKPLF